VDFFSYFKIKKLWEKWEKLKSHKGQGTYKTLREIGVYWSIKATRMSVVLQNIFRLTHFFEDIIVTKRLAKNLLTAKQS